jgi:hypothetical protein
LEAQILEQLRDADRDQLLYLLDEHDIDVELLSGEWRVLFDAAQDYYQVVDAEQNRARMAVSPDELQDFVELLRDEDRRQAWQPIAFGLAELVDALPVGLDLVGLVFLEESDDWMWVEQRNELEAIRPEVFEIIEPQIRKLMEAGDHINLARLCGDHCEGSVEFSDTRWNLLREHCREKVPELDAIFDGMIAPPSDYTGVREAINVVSDPMFQPSLDAWLRVHADTEQYALYFRDLSRERG